MSRVFSICGSALFCAALAVGLTACPSEDPLVPLYYPDSGMRLDGRVWTDLRPRPDFNYFPKDSSSPAKDGQGADVALTKDGGSCAAPTGLKCAASCNTNELCTEAQNGTCVKAMSLVGKATDKAILKALAVGLATCWQKDPAQDALCNAFDTCALEGSLTAQEIIDWVCNQAQIIDFPSTTEYDTARTVCGCGLTGIVRLDWISTLEAGQRGMLCLIYDVEPIYSVNHLNIDSCKNFPAP